MGTLMNLTKRAAFLASLTVVAGGLATTAPAAATPDTATAPCLLDLGKVDAAGGVGGPRITATQPPTREDGSTTPKVFSPGAVRLSSTWSYYLGVDGGITSSGFVVQGSTLYSAGYTVGGSNPRSDKLAIGGGWADYKALDNSVFQGSPGSPNVRNYSYGLRNDGVLSRWKVGSGWQALGSAAGFASVKAMTLISQTSTYDTFLANTRGGALYTIRIPISSPMKPVVKQVRAGTWQGFEYLVAQRCGAQSTLLAAVDTDTKSAYLYAVSHANGTSTVINSLGKLPGTFADPVYFNDNAEGNPPLNGE
jgi:hypothetical protein